MTRSAERFASPRPALAENRLGSTPVLHHLCLISHDVNAQLRLHFRHKLVERAMELGLTKEQNKTVSTIRDCAGNITCARDAQFTHRGFVRRNVGKIIQSEPLKLGADAANSSEGMDGASFSRHDHSSEPHVFGGAIMAPAQLVGPPQNICPNRADET